LSAILALPHIQQSAEGYCLLACVRMVLAHLGLKHSEVKVIRRVMEWIAGSMGRV